MYLQFNNNSAFSLWYNVSKLGPPPPMSLVRLQKWSWRKIDPKMSKTDPILKTRNWSRLVCQIDKVTVVISTWFFIVPSYFTLTSYRSNINYFYSSSEEDIELTIVCDWSLHSTCQHSMATFQELKQWICRWLYWSLVGKLDGVWLHVYLEGYVLANI